MKVKTICKITVDIAMTVILLVLMAHQGTGDLAHEWLGIAMFALFIAHNILNVSFYKNLFKGRYTAYRFLQTTLVFLVFAAMIGLMISGVMLSRHVFGSLGIKSGMSFARTLHLLSSYWGYLLMSLHLGLHWGMLMGMARKAAGLTTPSAKRTIALKTAAILIAIYGIYALVKRNFFLYMLLIHRFVFWNYDEPILYFFIDCLAIMGFCVFVAHYSVKLLQRHKKTRKEGGKSV